MSFSEDSVIKILIVERDFKNTEQLIEICKDMGPSQIDTTNSFERALELIVKTCYQLVIADSGIGGVSGLTLLERVKTIDPATSVILTSSFANVEEAVKAIRLGADEYFKKPLNRDLFKLAIRHSFEKRRLFDQDHSASSLLHLVNACQLISFFTDEEKVLESAINYIKGELKPKMVTLFHTSNANNQFKYKRIRTPVELRSELVEVLLEGNNYLQITFNENTLIRVFEKNGISPEVVVFKIKCAHPDPYFLIITSPIWNLPILEVESRFKLLSAQIEISGKNIQNYKGIRHLLFLDEPTGLFNTRYLHISVDQQFEAYNTGKLKQFSIMFIDVDKFKGVNDQYGHLLGTKILAEMAEVIRAIITPQDRAFRYGGDEFVILLHNKNSKEAFALGEKLRLAVEKYNFLSRENINLKLTISVGVASCPEHATNKRDVIELADHAMYEAKRISRNKVYLATKKAA